MEDGWEDTSQLWRNKQKKNTRIRDFNKWIGSFESHLLLGETICNTFNIIHVETVVNVNFLHSQAVSLSVCPTVNGVPVSFAIDILTYTWVKLPTFYFTLVKDSVI